MADMVRIINITMLLMSGIFLSGCSLQPNCCEMIYLVPDDDKAKESTKYFHNIHLMKVTGGAETRCHEASLLTDDELRCALEASLKNGDYLTPGTATYALNVDQESLEFVSEGTVQEARVVLKASLRNVTTNAEIFNERFTSTYMASVKASYIPGRRIQIAIEEATKHTIREIIERIRG